MKSIKFYGFSAKKFSSIFIKLFLMLLLSRALVIAQESNYIMNVKTGEAKNKTPLSISADLISTENISSIFLAFRTFGQNEFQKIEMQIVGLSASALISAEYIQPPSLEYYFLINLKDGSTQTYPLGIEEGVSPFQISVSGITEKDKEILVLSPSEGEIISSTDFLISVSFMRAPSNIDLSKTKIYLNNQEISQSKLIAGDLIVISGENIAQFKYGSAILKVEVFDNEGNLYHTINKSFQIVSPQVAAELAGRWKYKGNLRGESRNESFGSSSILYNNLSIDLKASSEQWLFNGYLYLTSEEKNYLQPYNRYSLTIRGGDILNLQVGDAYPSFPNLIMDGKRIRGFDGSINLGVVNVHAAYGETIRKVEGRLIQTYLKGEAPLASDVIAINESKYGYPYGKVNLGTYSRKIFVVRPSFGSGENFQLGFTYLHSKDDPNSVEFAARPQENAVFGSDLTIALDEQNIMFTSQAAFSIFNKDISSGTLSDSQIDSIFGKGSYFDIDPDQIKTIRDWLGRFITVNQYVGPLNPQKLASLAGEASLSLNYLNNSLRASYIYRGNDYQSFGQSFLRTDVKGINLMDRIRMFDNRFFLSFGYEKLEDNLQKTKIATTTYETFSTSVSLFTRTNFPNITFGYNRYKNNNGLKSSDTINNKYIIDDITNRFTLQLSYDLTLGIRHNTLFSLSTQKRDDNSLLNVDAKFNSAMLTVNSFWNSYLNSIFQLIYTYTKIANSTFEYFTLTAGAKYRLLENKLLLSATLSPSFGDFKRQAIELTADYNLISNMNLLFQARIYRFPGKSTNAIIGLTTRYTF